MAIEKYENGKKTLNNKDNAEWIEKVTCWKKEENDYNIYIFQVEIDSNEDLEACWDTIAAAIGTYFQSNLEKAIERWNIYLAFMSEKEIDLTLKKKIEQDKYSTRKVVWDKLKKEEINNVEYIQNQLFSFTLKEETKEQPDDKSLMDKVREIDQKLYTVLEKWSDDIDDKIEMYVGEESNE